MGVEKTYFAIKSHLLAEDYLGAVFLVSHLLFPKVLKKRIAIQSLRGSVSLLFIQTCLKFGSSTKGFSKVP